MKSVSEAGFPRSLLQKLRETFLTRKFGEKLLSINSHAFPHLYVVANLLLGLELVTYRGFTFRYLFLDARLMAGVAMLSYLILFIYSLRKSVVLPTMTDFVLQLNKLVIFPLFLINYLLISLDLYYYQNYVYSKFHINGSNFKLILSFNVLICVIQLIKRSEGIAQFVFQRLKVNALVSTFFLLSVAFFALPNLQLVTSWMYDASARILRTMTLNREGRFMYLNGGIDSTGWIWPYTQFINKHVAERGVIFIPPQKEAWQMEGNPYYMRWFIYPRFTVQSQEITAPIPEEADYVLIDDGAWPGMTEYGWPRVAIPAEKIEKMTFIDRKTHEETVITGQAYDPKTMSHKWGVIQLKK